MNRSSEFTAFNKAVDSILPDCQRDSSAKIQL